MPQSQLKHIVDLGLAEVKEAKNKAKYIFD